MKKLLIATGLVAAGALCFTLLPSNASAKVAKKAVTPDSAPDVELKDMQAIVKEKKAVIIDANGADTYAKNHIPGAISFAQHEGKLASVLPADKNTLIVAYCGGKMCSAWKDAAIEAGKLGYTNVKHFSSGIKGWLDAKQETESVKKAS